MSDCTPDSLRAYLVEHGPWVRADLIEPFADAWEADLKHWQIDAEALADANKRLEAARGIAEATLKRWKSRPWETTDNAERHMKDILASLAGEKP